MGNCPMSTNNRCGDCKHYAVARNPETNRPLPSKDGACTYPVEWPVLPKAFLPAWGDVYGSVRRFQLPKRCDVRKNDTEQCAVFEAVDLAKRSEQEPLL